MKKILALVLSMVMLVAVSTTVYAVPSSSGDAIEDEAGETSPETGDLNLVLIGLAGGTLAVTSVAAAVKSRKNA